MKINLIMLQEVYVIIPKQYKKKMAVIDSKLHSLYFIRQTYFLPREFKIHTFLY